MEEDEPSPQAWSVFLESLPGAGPFHLPAWRGALREAHPAMRDRTLWLEDAGGIRAALPVLVRPRFALLRAASLPYGTPGGAWLARPSDTEAATLLFAEFSRRFSRPWNDCIVVDHSDESLSAVIRGAWPGARMRPDDTHVVALPDSVSALEELWARRTRKAFRRAEGAGVEVRRDDSGLGLGEFARFHEREGDARKVRFLYPAPLLAAAARAGLLSVWIASLEGRTRAVTAVAEGCGRIFLWLVAHSEDARELPTGEILFGTILADAVRRGFREADFGSSGGRAGTRFFKEGFGAVPRPFRTWRSGPLARGWK